MDISFFKKYHNVKSFSDFFHLLTWKELEILTGFLLFLYLIVPCWAMIRMSIQYCGYPLIQQDVNYICTVLGGIALVLSIGKLITEQKISLVSLKEHRMYLYFSGLVSWMLISFKVVGITKDYAESTRYESISMFVMYFVICFGCGTIISRPEVKRFLFHAFVISADLIGIMMLLSYTLKFKIPSFNYLESFSIEAVFTNSNHYAYYMSMVGLISAGMFVLRKGKIWKLINLVSFILNTILIIIDNTFGCYLAILIGLIFFDIMLYIIHGKHNKAVWGLLGGYVLITVIMSFWFDSILRNLLILFGDIKKIAKNSEEMETAGSGRIALWKCALKYIAEKPIFGSGINGNAARFLQETGYCDRPHNEYLQYMVFHGIPAGILYIAGVLSVYLHGLRHKKELDNMTIVALGSAFGYLVSAFFGTTIYNVTPIFFVILGLGYHIDPKDEKISKTP